MVVPKYHNLLNIYTALMNSVLRYVASGSRGTLSSLAHQIASLIGTRPKELPELNSLEFMANQKQLLDVCFKSHLIENLKVQIGNKFEAQDERQLMLGLDRLPLHAYLKNTEDALNYSITYDDSTISQISAHRALKKYLLERRFNPVHNEPQGFSPKEGLVKV